MGNPNGSSLLWILRYRRTDNDKRNGSGRNAIRVEWFHLAHGRCLWQDLVNSVKKRWVSYDAENSLVAVKVLVYGR